MNSTYSNKNRASGFTLVELLVALAVISLFGCFVLPNAKKVITMAHVEADKQRLSALFGQYMYAANSGQLNLTDVKTMIDFSVALAKAGGPNEVSAYQSGKRKNKQRKEILIKGEPNLALNEEDFDFIFVNSKYGNGDRTPLFYTRGLQPDGTWCDESLYGSKGGIVVFEDGTMECRSSVDDDVLDCILGQKKGNKYAFLGHKRSHHDASPNFMAGGFTLTGETEAVADGFLPVHGKETPGKHQEVRIGWKAGGEPRVFIENTNSIDWGDFWGNGEPREYEFLGHKRPRQEYEEPKVNETTLPQYPCHRKVWEHPY